MKIKEITVSKGKKTTIKTASGGFDSNSADITLVVEAEDGKVNEEEIINKVKKLVKITMNDEEADPKWINEKVANEK